jgi:Tfp pilus assembly protein PilF
MRSARRTTAIILILLSIIPALALAQGRGRLIGKVVDPQGNAIQGVVVTVTSAEVPNFRDVETTDKRGTFTVDFPVLDVTYLYKFEKAGYQPFALQQKWHLEGTERFQWTLQPAGTAVVGGALPASTSGPAIEAFNAGVTAFQKKDYTAAEAKFREAVQYDPKLARAWASLSAVQIGTGHNKEAAESAEKAMALGVADEGVLTSRWQAYRNLKDDAKAAEALKDLEKAGRRTEEARKIHNDAVALVKAGDNAGAFAKFQEALNLDPNLQASQLGLATAGVKIGRNAEAATAAEAVLKEEPANEQALRLRYNACLALGDKPRLFDSLVGLAAVERAAALKGMLQLAFEAYDANDKPAAKDRFSKILAIDPSQPVVHYYLAMVHVNDGETDAARKELEMFLALVPTGKEADTAREMLKALKKQSHQ